MIETEAGLNQIVTVEIVYTDGTTVYKPMTKREAIALQDAVVSGLKPEIRSVKW